MRTSSSVLVCPISVEGHARVIQESLGPRKTSQAARALLRQHSTSAGSARRGAEQGRNSKTGQKAKDRGKGTGASAIFYAGYLGGVQLKKQLILHGLVPPCVCGLPQLFCPRPSLLEQLAEILIWQLLLHVHLVASLFELLFQTRVCGFEESKGLCVLKVLLYLGLSRHLELVL